MGAFFEEVELAPFHFDTVSTSISFTGSLFRQKAGTTGGYMNKKHTIQFIGKLIGALLLSAVLFLTGYLVAVERMVSLRGMASRPLTDWFGRQSAIVLDADEIPPEDTEAFNRVLGLLQTRYYKEAEPQELFNWALKGLAAGTGDPYTTYLTPEEMDEFQEAATGNYVGVGVTVNTDDDNLLTIVELFPDSPALAAGLQVGDKIIGVNGEDVTAITESSLIINRIKGEEGTEVTVTVYRPGKDTSLDFTMKRAAINVPNMSSEMLEENVAYIRLSRFDQDIAKSFATSWNNLHDAGATSLVIDLRYNPGGDFSQVVSIADMLLPEGLVVYTEDRNGNREEAKSDADFLDVPMVVLVNEYSASASEILAAALQDYDHAVVVGQKTFGKGLVQTIDTNFSNGAGFKYTISTYFSPNGRNIQGEGVEPDLTVVLDEAWLSTPLADIPEGQDNQLMTALAELRRLRAEP